MRPAQRRKRLKASRKKGGFPLVRIIVVLFFITVAFILVSFLTRFWDGKTKLTMAINTEAGDIIVSSFDPKTESVTNIFIPGSTQLNVSRQLGSWRAKSVWQLGLNEKLVGTLLRETVVKNFSWPLMAWADEPAMGFAKGDFLGTIKAVFTPFKTNLKIGDKIKLAVFALSVKNPKRENLDLRTGNYLKRVTLTDGEEGYIPTGAGWEKLIVYFADGEISGKNLRVEIKDATGGSRIPQEVGKVIEVIGAKVSAVTKVDEEEADCEVIGRNKKLVNLISSIYSCKIPKGEPSGNFDAQVKLGKAFVNRY